MSSFSRIKNQKTKGGTRSKDEEIVSTMKSMTGILITAQCRGCLLQSDVWCVKPDALGSREDVGRHFYCHSAIGGRHDRGPDSFPSLPNLIQPA